MAGTNKRKPVVPVILSILLVGAAVGGYWAYTHLDLELPFVAKEEPAPITLPVAVSMTNREGKTIDAIIVGRSATEVSLTKPEDPKKTVYTVPIANLSEKDQRFLEGVPISEYQAPKPDSPVVAARKKALEQLEARVAQAEIELKADGSSLRAPDWKATKAREIDALKRQIKQLKTDIQLLQKQKQQPK